MGALIGLRCVECGSEQAEGPDIYTCSACGGNLDALYDYARIKKEWSKSTLGASKESGIWRWLPLLPVSSRPAIPLAVGATPLVEAPRLARELDLASLHIKDDGRGPSASLKDRASAIAVARACEAGVSRITCASTGNAASSVATIASSIGLETVIFLPENAPRPKLAQLLVHGSHVAMIRGNYDTAYDLSLEATSRFGWYSRNSGFNPFLAEGKKTVGYEIAEAFAWEGPDRVFVAVGDGCIIAGVHKAFVDLMAIGWIGRMPKLVGVQAQGAAPLVAAFRDGRPRPAPIDSVETFADSIAVGMPRDGTKALRAARESGGEMIAVADDEIRDAMKRLARGAGIFAEPASAAGFAGLSRMIREKRVGPGERVVVISTGSGLKDVDSAMRLVTAPVPIEPDLDAVITRFGALE